MRSLMMLCALAALTLAAPPARAGDPLDQYAPLIGKLGDVATPLDTAEADRLLQPGNAVVRGRRYVKPKAGLLNPKIYAAERPVYLVPMTGYMAEWLSRFHGYYGVGVERISPMALRYAAQAITDERGNFEFKSLSPGTYVLISTQPFDVGGWHADQIGEEVAYNVAGNVLSRAPIYGESQFYSARLIDELVQVITIDRDDAVVSLGKVQ